MPVPELRTVVPERAVLVSQILSVGVAALLAFAAFRSGGYFPDDVALIGVVAFAGCAGALLVVGSRWRPPVRAGLALAAVTALAAWSGCSAAWSPDPAAPELAMRQSLTYAAVLLLSMIAVQSGRSAVLLTRLVVLVLVAVCVTALLSRLRPTLVTVDPAFEAFSQFRLSYPIGYWNALGAIAAMAIIGCVGLSAGRREPALLRGLYTGGGVLAGCTLYLTLSRGAGIALVAALAIIFAASTRRGRLAAAAVLVLGGGVVGALVIRQHPTLVDAPGTVAERTHDGGPVLILVVAIAVAAGIGHVVLAGLAARRAHTPAWLGGGSGNGSTSNLISAVLIGLLLFAVLASTSATFEGRVANGVVGLRSYADRQYGDFLDTSKPPPAGQPRLQSARSSRSESYRVATDEFAAHPLKGGGAGSFAVSWARERRVPELARNAHSLPLETAAELGLVGLLLLGALLGALGIGLRGLRRPRGGLSATQAAAAGGVLVVWLVHSAIDWDWQIVGVTAPALACAAALTPARSAGGRRRGGGAARAPRPGRSRATIAGRTT